MPVVEPYAISDPFSTAGKVNMNYQIMPFSSITRATAIEAVLRPEQILAVNAADGQNYKYYGLGAKNPRYYLDMDQTLLGFTNRFNSNDVFHSASEICSLWLVPEGQTYSGMQAFWSGSNSSLTGDNSREHPYADIYPRLTTKSNTYTVHFRVQTLKKVHNTKASQWIEGTDQVTGEYRGSSTIERYLDTSNPNIPDYATAAGPQPPLDTFYKFRVLETKQFVP